MIYTTNESVVDQALQEILVHGDRNGCDIVGHAHDILSKYNLRVVGTTDFDHTQQFGVPQGHRENKVASVKSRS